MTTLTYHGNVSEKKATLKQLRLHQKLDQIIQGTYWTGDNGDGKGCAVGCLTHDPDGGHDQYPERWGIPVQLAYLEDQIFESLSTEEAIEWPVRFMAAIPVGADLSGVFDKFCAWMLRDLVPIAGENAAVVEQMAVLFERVGTPDEPSDTEWSEAARAAGAARAAEAAGAAWAAWAAEAARAAGAAWAAVAAGAAWAAEAAGAARAAGAAWAAWAAERQKWARRAADELVRLVKAA